MKHVTFKPVVDGIVEGKDAFLPEDPWHMLQDGKFNKVLPFGILSLSNIAFNKTELFQVPMLVSSTCDEGLLFYDTLMPGTPGLDRLMKDERTQWAFHTLYRDQDEMDDKTDKLAEDIRETFFNG